MTIQDYTSWPDEALLAEYLQLYGTAVSGGYGEGAAMEAIRKEILRRMKKELDN